MCLRTANYVKHKNSKNFVRCSWHIIACLRKNAQRIGYINAYTGRSFVYFPYRLFTCRLLLKTHNVRTISAHIGNLLTFFCHFPYRLFTCRLLLKTHNVRTISAHIGNLLTFFCHFPYRLFTCRLLLKTHNVRTISAHIGNLLMFFCLLFLQEK